MLRYSREVPTLPCPFRTFEMRLCRAIFLFLHLLWKCCSHWLWDKQCCSTDARYGPYVTKTLEKAASRCLWYLAFAEKSYGSHTPGALQMRQSDSPEYHRLLANIRKSEVLPVEVLRTPDSLGPRGMPPSCHLPVHCDHQQTRWTTMNQLAENNWWGCSASEVPGPYGIEEGKRQGYLATSRQCGNVLLGDCH